MKKPFKIFPSVGYKNSQFQIISLLDNLIIDIYEKDEIIKSIQVSSKSPTLITKLNYTGKFIAKCKIDNTIFEQNIEIKDAFRLGSSVFKKAFTFDDTDYSFFLMKDRLLLYDEQKKILFTENHYSPTEIFKINKTKFLFVTKIENTDFGISNLGIYDTETFEMVGELLNDFREIKILPDDNKAWLFNIKFNTIHCFELVNKSNKYFTEIKSFKNFKGYQLDDCVQNIYIEHENILKFSNLTNINYTNEIPKSTNNAIDKLGYVFTIEGNTLTCKNILKNYSETIKVDFEINLQNENLIHIGSELKGKNELTDLNKKIEEIKDEVINLIPEAKTYHYHTLPEDQKIFETYITHRIYPTIEGIYIVQKKFNRRFTAVKFNKYQANWTFSPYTIERTEISLLLLSRNKCEVLIDKAPYLTISEYHNYMLLINTQNSKILFTGSSTQRLKNEDSVDIFTINRNSFLLIESQKKFTLFHSKNLNKVILDQIEILNPRYYKEHQIIWFRGKAKNLSHKAYLNAFDLTNCSNIAIDEKKLKHSLFKDAGEFIFFENYALSSNQIVFNPKTLEFTDAYIGVIESHSERLKKIISHRTNTIYLSIYNHKQAKYELTEIQLDNKKYKESYLSPNGQFLVLQDDSNNYSFFDIELNETIRFIAGKFLAFRNDGSLIVEQNEARVVKILDPKTFQDITPSNYNHHRFISPDGKLYAQLTSYSRMFNNLNGKELNIEEVNKIRKELDLPNAVQNEKEKEQTKLRIDENRQKLFSVHKGYFNKSGIKEFDKIGSQHIIKINKYIEIGIVGTEIKKEIRIPSDTNFYNYSAFSFDNKYLGIVGKPYFGSINRSLIMINLLTFDESNLKLELTNSFISRLPKYAAWVCGFSKTGYFATYDSIPDTFIIKIDDTFFSEPTDDKELRSNIYNFQNNIYNTYKKWNIIKNKNFLCFSPSGNFLALSEQGYEPLTLGGYGHQESSVVHIAKTDTGEIINSFIGHGDKIKDNFQKKVTFVAFSEDESRIMSLSSDGVVIIRNIRINVAEEGEKI